MWVAFANAKATHIFFFSKNISLYVLFNDQSFNDTLTNDIVSFEQLGPEINKSYSMWVSIEGCLLQIYVESIRLF